MHVHTYVYIYVHTNIIRQTTARYADMDTSYWNVVNPLYTHMYRTHYSTNNGESHIYVLSCLGDNAQITLDETDPQIQCARPASSSRVICALSKVICALSHICTLMFE